MGIIATWIDGLITGRRLSPGTRAVLEAIAADPERASYCSTAQLAEAAGVNVATVVRAAQAVDFSGWSELSTEVRNRYLASLDTRRHFERVSDRESGGVLKSLRKDLELMEMLTQTLSEEAVAHVIDRIAHARRTVVFSTGGYVSPGSLLSHNARGLGFDVALSMGSLTSMINDLRLLGPDDCLFTFAIWKTSTAIRQLCEIARDQGVPIIVIADHRSPLAELADDLLVVPSEGIGPVASVTCAVSVIQCIIGGLADIDPDRTAARLEEIEAMWSRTGAVTSE